MHNGFHSNNESCRSNLFFLAHSRKLVHLFNRCYSSFLRLCREKKDFSCRQIKVFDCEVKVWISIQIFSSEQGFLLIFRGNSTDFPKSMFAVKAKTHKLRFGSGGKILISRLIFLLSIHQNQQIRYSSSN